MTLPCGGDARRAGQAPEVDVLIESAKWRALPAAEAIVRGAITAAARAAQELDRERVEVSVLLCDDAAIAALNARWRGKSGPTNVLSFPAPDTAEPGGAGRPIMLGDIAVAFETAAHEAALQDKPLTDHLAHLVVHGFLHLLGYDHLRQDEAEQMERLERDILAEIGISDPYERWMDAGSANEAK